MHDRCSHEVSTWILALAQGSPAASSCTVCSKCNGSRDSSAFHSGATVGRGWAALAPSDPVDLCSLPASAPTHIESIFFEYLFCREMATLCSLHTSAPAHNQTGQGKSVQAPCIRIR